MKLLIDDAHIDLIKKICDYYPVDGVTTNPSIWERCRTSCAGCSERCGRYG